MATVLVVEDEIFIAGFVSEELAEAGHTVLTANNADEAIEVLEARHDITTIFTDIDMPGSMNGLKLAAAVRKRWPPIRIIITTGKFNPRPEEMPAGSIFLPKPYMTADLARAIESFR